MTKWLHLQSRKVTFVWTEDVDWIDNAQQIFWQENDKCLLLATDWSGRLLFFLCSRYSQAGLALKNPPKKTQKTHLKKPTKNVFFFGFFKFINFYENNTNFSLSNRFFMNK
jgi:hypothetical protein